PASHLFSFTLTLPPSTAIYTLSLHDALPICADGQLAHARNLVRSRIRRRSCGISFPERALAGLKVRPVSCRRLRHRRVTRTGGRLSLGKTAHDVPLREGEKRYQSKGR